MDVRLQWWRRISAILRNLDKGQLWIICADANVRLGSQETEAVGSHHGDPEDPPGAAFRSLAEALQTFMPSTFEWSMHGDGGTLVQKRNKTCARSDFICLPAVWKSSQVSAWIDTTIHAGHTGLDHFAVLADVWLQVLPTDHTCRRKPRFDAKAVADPALYGELASRLHAIQPRSWEISVHDHASLLIADIQGVLGQVLPRHGKTLRRDFLSSQTHSFVGALRVARKQLKLKKEALRLTRIRCAFIAWKQCDHGYSFDMLFQGRWLSQLFFGIALDAERVANFGCLLRQSAKADKIKYVEDLASQVDTASLAEIHRAVQKLLKPKRFAKGRQQPQSLLKWKDGSVCHTPAEQRARWRQFFAEMEAGDMLRPDELLDECQHVQSTRAAITAIKGSDMPSILDLDRAMHLVKTGRAPGLDGIPPEVCRKFATPMAVLWWPVLLKMMVHSSEPLILKGAELLTIPKGKGSPALCESSRGIILQSTFAKVLQRTTRGLMTGRFEEDALEMQLGSRKGLTALYGSFAARSFLVYAKKKGWSAALIFFDISSAFYSVIRELITGCSGDCFDLPAVARGLKLTEAELQGMAHVIACDPILGGGDSSQLLRGLAGDIHSATWFSLRNDSVIIRTRRGSRPGSPWADVLFGILFSRGLRVGLADHAVDGACFIPSIEWNGHRSIGGPTSHAAETQSIRMEEIIFADDLAIGGACCCAQSLASSTARLSACILDSFYGHGLQPNMGPEKTSALLAPVGQGSRSVRRQIYSTQSARLPVLLGHAASVFMDAVPSYKHLGCKISHDAGIEPEVLRRLQLGQAALREGKKKIYCNRLIALEKRALLFRGKVLACALHGAGAWPVVKCSTFRRWRSGILGMYRQLLLITPEESQHWTTSQIVSAVGLPRPEVLLHTERVRFVSLMFRTAPNIVWALAQADEKFLEGVWNAFDWLYSRVATTTSLPPPCGAGDAIDSWLNFSKLQPGKWKGLVKRAVGLDKQLNDIQAFLEMQLRDVWPDAGRPELVSHGPWRHACLICRLSFPSRQQWAVHAATLHGYRAPCKQLTQGRQCQACGRIYASSARLSAHLRAVTGCFRTVHALHKEGRLFSLLEGAGHPQTPVLPAPADFIRQGVDLLDADDVSFKTRLMAQAFDSVDEVVEFASRCVQPFDCIMSGLEDCRHSGAAISHEVLCAAIDELRNIGSGLPCKHRREADIAGHFIPRVSVLPSFAPTSSGTVLAYGTPDPIWMRLHGCEACAVQQCRDVDELLERFDMFSIVWCSFVRPPLTGETLWSPTPSTLRKGRKHMRWCRRFLLVWTKAMKAAARGGISGLFLLGVQQAQLGNLLEWSCQAGAVCSFSGAPALLSFGFHSNLACQRRVA